MSFSARAFVSSTTLRNDCPASRSSSRTRPVRSPDTCAVEWKHEALELRRTPRELEGLARAADVHVLGGLRGRRPR